MHVVSYIARTGTVHHRYSNYHSMGALVRNLNLNLNLIYIGGHFLRSLEEKALLKSHKSPLVAVSNTTLCSLDVIIRVDCITASDKTQELR